MKNLQSISALGIGRALDQLLPHVRNAGRLARLLQPQVARETNRAEKGGSAASSALTDVDLLVEDIVGGAVCTLFDDASFYGEEGRAENPLHRDRISRFIPDGRPYTVTLDPVNGTLGYRDGLPHFETIATICDASERMLGSIIYRPAHDDAYVARAASTEPPSHRFHRPIADAWHVTHPDEGSTTWTAHAIKPNPEARGIYVSTAFECHAGAIRAAGYEPIFHHREYAAQPDWPHTSMRLLDGSVCALLKHDAQLIDAGAISFTAQAAGGCWRTGPYDPKKKTFAYSVAAADKELATLLESLVR